MSADSITLREASEEDLSFLARNYADTRREEMMGWEWTPEQQNWFLRMQFEAQRNSYRTQFPRALEQIVIQDGSPIGRMLTDEDDGMVRLIDISLIAEKRGQGIGTRLINNLVAECERRSRNLLLHVSTGNRAIHLYERLGFEQTASSAMYIQMEHKPKVVKC